MIRLANKFDIDQIVDMLAMYREHSPLECHKYSDDKSARNILAQIFAGRGAVFVSDENGKLNGMLIAMINPNIWDKTVLCINELAYWVNEDSRHGTIGYRLLKEYIDYCKQAKALGTIQYYTISKMVTSPDLKYDKFGFSKLEETWSA